MPTNRIGTAGRPRPAALPRARAGGCGRRALSRRAQPGAAAGGGDARRAGAGAGRRRHRQDPGADHAHRPHPRHRPGAAGRNPRRHLHQQGGARDEAARRRDGRRRGRGHAVARHLPLDRREDPAPPRRAGGAQARLHHPRRRRPDPADQAAARGREHRREALAGARAGDADRRLEEPRPHARPGAAGRRRGFAGGKGHEALQGLPGAAEDAERRRFRRPAAGEHPAVPRATRRAAAVSGALQVHPGRRIPGHQRRAVSVAAAAGAEQQASRNAPGLVLRDAALRAAPQDEDHALTASREPRYPSSS